MKIGSYETHKFADIFPMIAGEELEILKNDIKEHGLLNPIVLYEEKILDGRNRLKACIEMDLEPRYEHYKGDKPLDYVISLNLKRRHLSQSQAGVIALEVLPLLEEEAKRRQQEAGETFGRGMSQEKLREKIPEPIKAPIITEELEEEIIVPQKIDDPENIELTKVEEISTKIQNISQKRDHKKETEKRSSTQASKLFNVNERYVRQAKKLKEKADKGDKKAKRYLEEVKKGDLNFSQIKKQERAEKIQLQREEIKKEALEKPTGDFDVIVIDPPWEYSRENSSYDPQGNRAMVPYPEISMDELKKIKLPAKDDCVLWLWTTNGFMKDAYDLISSWGFKDKTILTWDKQFLGAGWWLRNITEHCILAVKGEPRKKGVFKNEKWTTLISEKRTEHSVKPDIFYKMVEEICVGRKLDYFARKKRENWEVYGDEVK